MSLIHILIMDRDPHACPEDHCGRLATLLHGLASASAIRMQTVTRLPSETLFPPPDLILLRSSVTKDLPALVQCLRGRGSPVPVLGLFCIAKDTPAVVLQAFSNDLEDFLTCPFRDIDVFPRVQRLLWGKVETTATPQAAEMQAQFHFDGLVGESDPFLRVLQVAHRVAHADTTVLISGETGTGKELVAQAIHYHSPRRGKPFVPVNCGSLPEHLVENELFGHARGAYTDASSPEQGLIAEAEDGTLFLDEVDTLSPSAQVKLLRFLQDRTYRPLGSTKSKTADVRIIAATNTDLQRQIEAQRFREDLYYRLNIISLRLPPLRERTGDVPLLASHFLRRYGNHYGREALCFSADTLQKLGAYLWPGNVRELETVIQRAVILGSSPVLQPEDIDLPFSYQSTIPQTNSFREAKAQAIEQFERTYLTNLLTAYEGNITHAAKQVGEARRSLQRLLKKYGLKRRASQT